MKGINGWGIFYRLQDSILYYTMYSVLARQMSIPVISFSIMFNHTHALTVDVPRKLTGTFQRRLAITFALHYNREYNRKGKLFMDSFGCSEKTNTKSVMGCTAYVANNSVAGHVNARAVDDRWTMLAYYNNAHPFSTAIVKKKCRPVMLKAMALVDACFANNAFLNYALQKRIYSGLFPEEKKQITDYIVYKYRFLDYNMLIDLYGSYEKALIAIDSNAGSEYEIKDEYGDHSCYRMMLKLMRRFGYDGADFNFENLDSGKRIQLANKLLRLTGASMDSIRKFLHLSVETKAKQKVHKA